MRSTEAEGVDAPGRITISGSVAPEEHSRADVHTAILDALRTLALMLSGADGSSEFYESFIKVGSGSVTLTAEGQRLLADASHHARRHAALLTDLEFGGDTDLPEFTSADQAELASVRRTVNQIAWTLWGAELAVSQPTLDGIPGSPTEALFVCAELSRNEYLKLMQAAAPNS